MLGKFVEAIVAATALVYLTDSRTKTMQVKYTRTMAAKHCNKLKLKTFSFSQNKHC
jgi:hypothetical protein